MKTIYVQEDLSNLKFENGFSIYLAGPTPIKETKENLIKKTLNLFTENTKSWRNDAISYFKEKKFNGTLLIPEERSGESFPFEWESQIEWQMDAITKSDYILFWIPRNLIDMPGCTTNIEFGYWLGKNPEKIVVGAPKNTRKMKYIKHQCKLNNILYENNLKKLVQNLSKK